MIRYIERRILWGIALLFITSAVIFVIFYAFPSADPAVLRAGRSATPAQIKQIRESLGLDDPIYVQYWLYMKDAPKDRDNFFYWEGSPPPSYNNVMTWWVEPKEGGGTLIRYGTGNLGRNGTHWEADFMIGKWHRLAMHIHWSEDPEKGNTRLWFDGVPVLDKKLNTKGPESVYFCQPGIHRSPHRPSVDTIYFDNFILADTLEDVLKER